MAGVGSQIQELNLAEDADLEEIIYRQLNESTFKQFNASTLKNQFTF